jgi:hypothetical protein
MGLDQYLYARKYVAGWKQDSEEHRNEYERLLEMFGMTEFVTEHSPSATVQFTVAYWRKANAIHGWFVREVQGGEDECLPHDVDIAQLKDLHSACMDILLTKERYGEEVAAERGMVLLPPVSGFFFGVTDISDWYWQDLDDTVEQLDRVFAIPIPPKDWQWGFQYRSSW